jgi:RecA-family ATPase
MTAAQIAQVAELRQRLWQCGYRPIAVWNPDQLFNDKDEPLNNPGKQPRGRWREDASHNPPEAVRTAPDPRALNTGLLCGDIVGFDIDVLDQALVDQIVELIEDRAGPTPLKRIGLAPKLLLVYRTEHPFTKIKTPELFFPDGGKAQVELLAEGQQFVAAGIHPETHQPYRWLDQSPADSPLEVLPIVSQGDARALVDLAEQFLRAAGAKEKEKPEPTHPIPNGRPGNFFAQINAAALADIPAWARLLFPHARFEPGTGAWRVSSKDLGRSLEEDISIHPDGIRDFGEEAPLSAIDLAIRYGTGTATAVEAALWLCDQLGIQPSSLGFRRRSQAQPHAAVPFMITRMQKELLAGLGYTAEQIREMTPADGDRILKEHGIHPEIPQPTPAGGNGHDPEGLDDLEKRSPPPPAPDPPEPLQYLDFITLQDKPVPVRRWLVLNWVPWGRVTGLYGPSGDGKTLLIQQLLTAAAIRKQWLGRGVFPLKSIGLFCEDDRDDLHIRQADINKLYDCEFGDLENFRALPRLGCDNLLMTFLDGRPRLTGLWHQLRDDALEFGAQLIFIDTVADTFGGNQNDPIQARMFVQFALGGLARDINGIVIASAHPSIAGQASGSGTSGSVQWDATFRSRCYLQTPKPANGEAPDSYARTLTRKKANYAPREETIPLRWEHGVFINTDNVGILGSIERRTAKRVFLDLLDAVTAEKRHVSENTRAPNYAPKLFAQRPDREGFRQADFKTAMETLFAEGEITIQAYRKNRHDHDCIMRSARKAR